MTTEMIQIQETDKTYMVSKAWYDLLLKFKIELPIKDLMKICFVKCNEKILNLRHGYLVVFKTPIPFKGAKGYYIIPGFSKYAINNKGYVISTKTCRRVSRTENVYGYWSVSVFDDDKQVQRSVAIHLLLGRTFVRNNDWELKTVINHRDGNKKNINLNNLEWVSPAENARHALETGLRKDNIGCLVKDLSDGSIKKYHSLSQAFKSIGCKFISGVKHLEEGDLPLVVYGRYEFKLQDDSSPWYFENMSDPRLYNRTRYNFEGPYEALNLTTGEVLVGERLKDISNLTKVDVKLIRTLLLKRIPTATKNFYFRKKSNNPLPDIKEIEKHEPRVISYNLKAENITEGKVYDFKSIREMSIFTGLDKFTIKKMINHGKVVKNWIVRNNSPIR